MAGAPMMLWQLVLNAIIFSHKGVNVNGFHFHLIIRTIIFLSHSFPSYLFCSDIVVFIWSKHMKSFNEIGTIVRCGSDYLLCVYVMHCTCQDIKRM